MRIIHAIDYFHTDVGYQEYFLALEQAREGHQVRVVTSTARHHTVATAGPDEVTGATELEEAGVEVVRLPARQLGHDRAWIPALASAISAFGPDAIHCHGPFSPTTLTSSWAASRAQAPVLVDNHMQRFIAPGALTPAGRAFYMTFRQTAARYLRRHVADWIAIGPHEAEFLAERMGLQPDEVGLIPLGFDPSTFHFDAAARQRLRSLRGWSSDTVVAVTGKLHPRKRVDVVAAACARAARRGAAIRLVLAGDIDPDHLRQTIEASGPLARDDRLTVLPMLPKSDLADLYLAADVVVFPRLPSISIYEAIGTGAKVVVGKDAFADWLHGLHPGIESVEEAGLHEVLLPHEHREQVAAEAAAVFSWRVVSNEFLRRYESMR